MDLIFFFVFRSYFLHKLQAEAFGSCLELGDLLAQQVKMRSFWMLFCEIVVLFEVSLVQLICLRFCVTDFELLFFWRWSSVYCVSVRNILIAQLTNHNSFKLISLPPLPICDYFARRQLGGSVVQEAHLDGFLSHLQKEQIESILKEEPNLHIYSSNDVDM